MKGPMTTQSLRGMANHGPMHWRGDRTGGNDPRRPDAARRGRGVQEVQRRVRRPARPRAGRSPTPTCRRSPTSSCRSPIRRTRSARSTTRSPPDQQAGHDFFFNADRPTSSADLQRLPHARPGARASSAPTASRPSRARPQDVQDPAPAQPVPEGRHVRHAGSRRASTRRQRLPGRSGARLRLPARRQRRHASSASSTPRVFNAASPRRDATQRRQVEQFILAFDTQPGARSSASRSRSPARNAAVVGPRIDLLIARADGRRVRPGREGHASAARQRGWLYARQRAASSTDRASERAAHRRAAARAGRHRRPGAHLHLRAAGLRRAHRHRPRRGRLLRPRRARRRQRPGRSARASRAVRRRPPPRRPRPVRADRHHLDHHASTTVSS